TVQTTEDTLVEEDETFSVSLANPTNGAVISSTQGAAKGTIIDDDDEIVAVATLERSDTFGIFTIRGSALKVTLVEHGSTQVNELGVFLVDNAQGSINGIAPGASGYNQAALDRAKTQSKAIFSVISDLPNGFNSVGLTRLLGFNSGEHLKFFLIKDGTIDSYQSGQTPASNILFANPSNQRITGSSTQGFTLDWEDGTGNSTDFKDLIIKIESTNDDLVLGTNLQGQSQAEIIDLSDISGQVRANFSVFREASFNNEVYFYEVDSVNGQIGSLQANANNRAAYLQAAINNLLKDATTGQTIKFAVSNQGTQTGSATINAGSIFAPMIVINGTLSELMDNNGDNDPRVYFPYLGVNSDGVDHIRLLGNNTFGFEDLPNGGDRDYNDVIVKFNFSSIV
ncbi:DUF4114 domain-containing protein, partial [Cronbergia sp. UHCC 0137]|uniref:DUF4114 domain-containing protein n=1 Tax=Cronbergia sp. UHCC 0137 TaxID=3110239 RepID=UPI002B20133C